MERLSKNTEKLLKAIFDGENVFEVNDFGEYILTKNFKPYYNNYMELL